MIRDGLLVGTLVLGFGPGRAQLPVPVSAMGGGAELRTVDHNAFRPGEKLTYVVHYGLMDAGEAVLELQESDLRMEGRPLLHAKGVERVGLQVKPRS